jgi:glutamate-1-semialdehyde 2,1-aminomutase
MLDKTGKVMAKELQAIFNKKSIPVCINRIGSMFSVHFTEGQVTNYTESAACDHKRFNAYFHHMLKNGVYLPPSSYESWFFNIRLEWDQVEKILDISQTFEI